MARLLRAAQASSASALVPRMSDLKPPSQNSPGAPPERARTAICRVAAPVPTLNDFRQESSIRPSLVTGRTGFSGKGLFRRS
jgi:hypothetical protein